MAGGGNRLKMNDSTDSERSDELNQSLDDVIDLLAKEIERLKLSLETYRLSRHPKRAEIIRWHVQTLDERQDALEELQALILAERDDGGVH